jgi:hypothetical protein
VAQGILDRLSHQDAQWTVTEADPVQETEYPVDFENRWGHLEVPRTVLVRAAKVSDPSTTISSYFVLNIPTQQAIAQLASALQDEVIETVSAAVPPCPDHPHPLSPRGDSGLAVWTCPLGAGPQYPIADLGQAE